MADDYCRECKLMTTVVFDRASGDAICTECGLVLESHTVDEKAEWRTFADENDNDPNRVGAPVDPFLGEELGTVISMGNNPNSHSVDLRQSLGRWQQSGTSSSDKVLKQAFNTIENMAVQLNIVATVVNRAKEMYKKLEHVKATKGRNQFALAAACLYIASSQEENLRRTVKEIASVANGATLKDIHRAKKHIMKQLEVETGPSVEMGTIQAGDFVKRFAYGLHMKNQDIKAAQEAVQKLEVVDIRRSPISVAAAIVYMISQLSDDKKLLRDVSVVTRVAESTIRNSMKDLFPHAKKLIPSWYANEELIDNMHI